MLKNIFLSVILSALFVQALAQNSLQEGAPLPPLNLKDQHDKALDFPSDIQRIIFASDNTAASLVTPFLDTKKANWLKDERTVYLADIHRMPSLVTRMFALPQLREKSYSIGLGREEKELAAWPKQKGCVSVIQVLSGKLHKFTYACDAAALDAAIKP